MSKNRMKLKSAAKAPVPKPAVSNPEDDIQFDLEVTWCIQHLEILQFEEPENKRSISEKAKAVAILKSKNQPYIKKRQVMKQFFPDYRQRMLDEEREYGLDTKIVFTRPKGNESSFIKKSTFLTDDSSKNFKFNFNLNKEVDNLSLNDDAKLNAVEEISVPTQKTNPSKKLTFSDNKKADFKFNFTIT